MNEINEKLNRLGSKLMKIDNHLLRLEQRVDDIESGSISSTALGASSKE